MTIGERVRAERTLRGWSVRETARQAKISPSYVTMMEKGERTRLSGDILLGLAQAFGVTVDDLLGNSPATNTEDPPLADLRASGWSEERLQDLVARWERLSPRARLELTTIARDVVASRQQMERRIEENQERIDAVLRDSDSAPKPAV